MLKFIYKDKKYEVLANMFAYDGCHKIYLITSEKDKNEAWDYSYQLRGVEELPAIWDATCPLRFIQFWDVENLKRNLVPQCFDAKIERFGTDIIISFDQELGEEYDSWMEEWIDGFIKNGVLVYA